MESKEDDYLKEIQKESFVILNKLIEVCEQNDIQYFLGWGSCLGAVRHQGFIPWDDDIDVLMPYKDYMKLQKLSFLFKNDGFFLQNKKSDSKMLYPRSKLQNSNILYISEKYDDINPQEKLGIDIFPLYNYAYSDLKKIDKVAIKILNRLYLKPFYKFVRSHRYKKKDKIVFLLKKMIYNAIPNFVSNFTIKVIEDRFSKFHGDFYLDLDGYVVLEKSIIGEGRKNVFENMDVYIPTGYDAYLRKVYGDDYMEIPEEGSEKRYAHNGKLIMRDND